MNEAVSMSRIVSWYDRFSVETLLHLKMAGEIGLKITFSKYRRFESITSFSCAEI